MTNLIAKAVLSAALLSGCGGADTGYVFSPSPDLSYATAAALGGILSASGLPVSIGSGGVPVRRWNDGDPSLDGACAQTVVTYDHAHSDETLGIEIQVPVDEPENCDADDRVRIIQHELIHALRGWEHGDKDPDQGHSLHGVFQARRTPGDDLLDETSLVALCERVPCSAFTPEAP